MNGREKKYNPRQVSYPHAEFCDLFYDFFIVRALASSLQNLCCAGEATVSSTAAKLARAEPKARPPAPRGGRWSPGRSRKLPRRTPSPLLHGSVKGRCPHAYIRTTRSNPPAARYSLSAPGDAARSAARAARVGAHELLAGERCRSD